MKCVTRVLKLFLCILILFCGAVVGLHFSQRLIRRRSVLSDFEVLFHRVLIRIEYNAGELCEVFSDNFADYHFIHHQPFDVQWRDFIKSFSYVLTKDDMNMLLSFTDGLGAADCDAQRQHITLFSKILQEHIEDAQEDIRTKAKMYRIIPLSVGIVISLIVI